MAFARVGYCGRSKNLKSSPLLPMVETRGVGKDEGTQRVVREKWMMRYVLAALLALLLPLSSRATTPTFDGVATVLSTGSITLGSPVNVAVDAAGNVYIPDLTHNQIVEVSATGVASVLSIAGLGTPLNQPEAVAADQSGYLYIADTGNARIVKVTGGVGSVVSVSVLLHSPRSVAVDGSGNLFIVDVGQVIKVAAGGSAAVFNITGLSPALSAATSVGVDSAGNVYVADPNNHRVIEATPAGVGSVVNTSGLGTPLNNNQGVAVDGSGNVYIADTNNNRVVEVSGGSNSQVLGMGSTTLNQPFGVGVSVYGNVYVADTANQRVVELMDAAVNFGELQLGAATSNTLTLPFSIGSTALGAVDAFTFGTQGLDFAVASGSTCTIGTTSTNCAVNIKYLPTAAGLRRGAVVLYDGATPANAMLTIPLYGFSDAPLAALSPNAVTVMDTGGVALTAPIQVAMDGAGNLYSANYEGNNVVKVAAGGGSATVVNTGSVTLSGPAGVVFDGAGNLFVADYYNSRIVVVTAEGAASVLTISGLSPSLGTPVQLAMDSAGALYITDFSQSRIVKVSNLVVSGSSSSGNGTVIGLGSYTIASSSLTGLAVDPQGTVYVADRFDNQVIQVTAAGTATLLVPMDMAFNDPQGVSVDAMGNIYVVDTGNDRIVQITTAGVASAVQMPRLQNPTSLGDPFGVTADVSGNLYISDFANNRIVQVSVSAAGLTFPNTNVGSTSAPMVATVTNLGNQPLVFASDPSYTAIFAKDGSDTNTCGTSNPLTGGNRCDVAVTFAPQAAGPATTGISFTDNQLNGVNVSQQVVVGGVGVLVAVTPTINWSAPAAITYGTGLSGVLDAAAVDGSTSVAGTYAYTATPQGGSASPVTGATALGVGSYTLAVAFTPNDTTHYNSASGSVSLTVGKATPGITLSAPATVVPLNTAVTFTARVSFLTGTPTGSVNFYDGTTLLGSGTLAQSVATYTAASLAAGTHSITATYGGDGNFLTATSAVLAESAGKTAPAVALTASANAVMVTTAVTFKATVSGSGGTPSGSVGFYDGTTLLGSGTLASGMATFTTSSLAVGVQSITAAYGGDATFAPLTSAALTETVEDFAVSVSNATEVVAPRGTASYALKVAPSGGSTLPAAVTLSVSGLPVGATATITPATLAAGVGSANVTVAIQVSSQVASLGRGEMLAFKLSPLMVGMLLLPFGGAIGRKDRRYGRAARVLMLAVVVFPAVGLAGCGSRNVDSEGAQQNSYAVTVTGTSGTVAHSASLTLIVQ